MHRLLLILLGTLLLAGCQTAISPRAPYYEVIATDFRGNLIASWTAAGPVRRVEGGRYYFVAVERRIPNPPREFKYVVGRRVTISAPNVEVHRVSPPVWLREVIIVE
jgi:hypothetical protein